MKFRVSCRFRFVSRISRSHAKIFSSISANFRSFALLAGFALVPKFRNVTKIGHTVWPPPINGNKKRKDSLSLSGYSQVLPWCRLCQTATVIIWSLGKRRKRPKPNQAAAAATPNEPKGTKRTRRTHSVRVPPDTEQHHSERRCGHGRIPFTEGMWSLKRGRHLVESVSHIFLGYQKPRVSSTARRLEDHTPPRASVGAKP